jgi:hypothetical protein
MDFFQVFNAMNIQWLVGLGFRVSKEQPIRD